MKISKNYRRFGPNFANRLWRRRAGPAVNRTLCVVPLSIFLLLLIYSCYYWIKCPRAVQRLRDTGGGGYHCYRPRSLRSEESAARGSSNQERCVHVCWFECMSGTVTTPHCTLLCYTWYTILYTVLYMPQYIFIYRPNLSYTHIHTHTPINSYPQIHLLRVPGFKWFLSLRRLRLRSGREFTRHVRQRRRGT
jgi:hypothetical protein